jgi:hypothetical protein
MNGLYVVAYHIYDELGGEKKNELLVCNRLSAVRTRILIKLVRE